MQSASRLITQGERAKIEGAVRDAESKTSCEIVPVVATSSGRYDRAEDVAGLWCSAAAAVLVWMFFPREAAGDGSWGGLSMGIGAAVMVAAVFAAFIAGAVAGSRIWTLRRLFCPRRQMVEEVAARARSMFFDSRVHHTDGGTGILIYISLFEQMAVVLGDQTVVEKLGQPFLDELRQRLISDLGQKGIPDALCSTIAEAGSRLSAPLPRAANDVNELHNALILVD